MRTTTERTEFVRVQPAAAGEPRSPLVPGRRHGDVHGETVAVQGKTFYSGLCDLIVEWHATTMGGDEVGRLVAVAAGLESEDRAPLSCATQDIEGSLGSPIRELIFA